MAGEECILSGQGNRSDQVLDIIRVDLDTAIAQEGLQPIPVAVDIGQLFTETRLHRYAPALRLHPFAEGRDQRSSERLAGRQPLDGAHAADLSLDPVKLGNPAQTFGCDLGSVAI